MKPQGTFRPESIEQLYAAYAEKHGGGMGYDVNAQSFAEAYDYMTCQRPDGSTYGTSGQCRKGKEVSPEDLGVKPPKGGVGPMSSSALAEVKEAAKSEAYSWGDNHDKLFDKVYAKAETTAHLGKIHKAVMKAVDEGDIDAKEGTLKIIKKAMEGRLKTEMRSGQGAKREAELAKMTPEERRRARTEEAIKRGIKNKVVKSR
jgi:hypothetical protein